MFLFTSLFLALLGLHCCSDFSLVAASRGYSQLQAPGFSLRWLLSLRSPGSRAQAKSLRCTGFAVPQHVGPSQMRERTHVSCIGRWILYH